MKKILFAAAAGLGLLSGSPALASSHREAPAISKDPAADNTDVYAWVNATAHDKLNVVMAYNPMEEPAGGPNFNEFSTDVLYQLHITRGKDSLADVATYQFTFSKTALTIQDPALLTAPLIGGKEFFSQLTGQQATMRVTKVVNGVSSIIADNVKVAPPNVGPATYTVVQKGTAASTVYDDAFAATFISPTTEGAGGRVWAGPRDDGFYVDLGGVFDLANILSTNRTAPKDGVAGYNVHAIAIEIPTTSLTSTGGAPGSTAGDATLIGVWASASRRQIDIRLRDGNKFSFGPWVQISRLGLPLINEAVIGLQDKDKWNAYTPLQESVFFPYFLNPVIARDAAVPQVGIYTALGKTAAQVTALQSGRADIIAIINLDNSPAAGTHHVPVAAGSTGDVLRLDMATDSGFPNGRTLVNGTNTSREGADVTDVLLSVLLLGTATGITDNVNKNDKAFPQTFPWLALPFQGFASPHNLAAP